MDLLANMTVATALAVVAIASIAGFVKGAVGFAMPMILVSGLGSVFAPEIALAALIVPTLVSNLWQAFRQGWQAALASARRHWRYLAILLVVIGLSAQLVTLLSQRQLFLILGVPVTFFAMLQLAGWAPKIRQAQRRAVEMATATVAGFIGGLSGVWGPPTVLYLTALDTPKDESKRVQGVVYGAGAVALTGAHISSGVLNMQTLPLSVAVAIPASIALVAGFKAGDRMDQERFRKITLIVLTIAGLNLIRRAMM